MKDKLYFSFKRILDLSIVLLSSPFFVIIILVTAVLIKLTSPGPVIFRQKRVGLNGKEFEIIKFRSMYIGDNDQRLAQDPVLYKKYKEAGWKLPMSEDPRITPVGRFIRTFTIDEFPQLINVLKGEMSIVGPRAYRQAEVQDQIRRHPSFKKLINEILSVKPGITGPWQTSGRNEVPFLERA